MKYRWLVVVILIGCVLVAVQPAQAVDEKTGETYPGTALCLPDAYLNAPGDCLPLGPSQTLTDMAKKGLTFPPRPLPAVAPPRELSVSPVNVAKINIAENETANIYTSLNDAVSANNPIRKIAAGAGLRFVSYINKAEVNGASYVQLKSGEWLRASPAGYLTYQGLLFQKTPLNSFGWMIDQVRAHEKPSWNSAEVGDLMNSYTVIQIYDIVKAEGMEWYMIGPDQWVPDQKARRVRIDTTPPKGVTGDRWINVDLFDQTLAVYDNRQLVFATLIATGGKPFYTRPGLFKINQKKPLETMSGAFEANKSDFYYLEDVPWTMYFDKARALHGAYWRTNFGYPGSHGCVNLSPGDSHWLFDWAQEGDWVYVWDPTGKTPTDPAYYGEGGA